MAVGVDDWLVADSEDEDTSTQLPLLNGLGASTVIHIPQSPATGNLTLSDIQTAAFSTDKSRTPQRGRQSPSMLGDEPLFTPPKGGIDPTISDFADATSTSGAPSGILPKPRPRPRVVMKKVATTDRDANVASTPFSHISDPPISTRQTDDSIHVATTASVDDTFSSFGIAERAKMRSRKSQTAKKTVHLPYLMDDVIELTSDEDELTLKPAKGQKKKGKKPKIQTKSRSKPTLKAKTPAVLPIGSPSSRTVIRDPPSPPAQCVSSSQLPASTLPTIPPSTPPQARELTPPSSPPLTTRKRKRILPLITDDDDEMDIIGDNPAGASPLFVQPPTFFAPSSSSVPTDSGVEIPPVEPLSGQSKKNQGSSSKKRTQSTAQNKGRKGRKATGRADEESESITPDLAMEHTSSFAEECHSSMAENPAAKTRVSGKRSGTARAFDSHEEEDELDLPSKSNTSGTPRSSERGARRSKENLRLDDTSPSQRDPPPEHTSTSGLQVHASSVILKTPMSELIRRVNSQPSSPFPNASRTYSPILKSSRTMLSRIAPLHPNRRTPPPPMPRPPPPKKSKKQLEMEEKIEEELAETVDGWVCLTDEERKALKKARIDAELGYE